MINIKINGRPLRVRQHTTILDAAKAANIKLPTLCHLNLHEVGYYNSPGNCRVCMVELGNGKLVPACVTQVTEGMEIFSESVRVIKARRTIIELLLSDHPNSCLTCEKNTKCDLQLLAHDLGVREIKYKGEMSDHPIDTHSLSIVRDPNKCILCMRCVTMCSDIQTVGALTASDRGFDSKVGSSFDSPMQETTCTFCGQCLSICPTGALTEVNNSNQVWDAIADPDKYVVVQTAPAVRVALGEEFGYEVGTNVTGKMVAALRNLGVDRVYDTNFAADLTIVEEAAEFMRRLENGGTLPMITSCCPSWVNFMEHSFPDMLDNPSSTKSPHEMFGAVAKTYLAKKLGIAPEKIYVVSVMPCVSKKFEAARDELRDSELGYQVVDNVITTRELARMIKEAGIAFEDLPNEDFDELLGESTGAGTIFGATGGVLEATLRTCYQWMTGDDLTLLEFESLRGFSGVKAASVTINGKELKFAVCNGLGNTRKVIEKIRAGEIHLDAIEVMACPGGCIGGAGQPYHHGDMTILSKRSAAIYNADKQKMIRKSNENPEVLALYEEYLGEINSPLAHELLHTTYTARPRH